MKPSFAHPLLAAAVITYASAAAAQSGGFVMTLGADTVQVEQFARSGNTIVGTIATRAPTVKLLRYTITLGNENRWERYEQLSLAPNGAPLDPDPARASMLFAGDSIIRDAIVRGQPATHRLASPNRAFPAGTIPIGASFVVFEFALAHARTAASATDVALYRLIPNPMQTAPSRTAVLSAAPDSVVVDYFGQGSFIVRYDAAGHLVRSDWRNTTYKVIVERVARVDAIASARAWSAKDAAVGAFGALSPRDTVHGEVSGVPVWIDYSRPARRGRQLFGGIVPWNVVWRLGADFATQFHTDRDLLIGQSLVPAGNYTLWMLPRADSSLLVVNRQVGIFGTQYNPRNDLVRVPLELTRAETPAERLSISVRDGRLWIVWGDAAYSIKVATP